jgi:hypothetical protein
MILGIDPGFITGIAVLSGQQLYFCKQFPKSQIYTAIKHVIMTYGVKKAAIEMPRLAVLYDRPWAQKAKNIPITARSTGRISIGEYQKMMDSKEARASNLTAGQIKIAQNVGQNIEFTHRLIEAVRSYGVQVVEVTPKPRGSKWNVNFWARTFSWQKTRLPGEHARDAATIGYLNG